MFILVLEIAFLFIMQNENINSLNIFEKIFLYTAYADGTTILLKDEKSEIEIIKTSDVYSLFSGLKPIKSKYEIASLVALKGVKLAICEMACLDLMLNTIRILGVCYSFDKYLEN